MMSSDFPQWQETMCFFLQGMHWPAWQFRSHLWLWQFSIFSHFLPHWKASLSSLHFTALCDLPHWQVTTVP